jgi:hypothetical protein
MRSVVWAVLGAVVIGVGTGLLGMVGVAAGSASLSVTWSVAGRAVLSLAALVMLVLLVARRGPWESVPPVLLVAAAGLVLDPLLWTATASAGGALAGVPLTGSTLVGVVVDAVLWLLVSAGVTLVGVRSRDDVHEHVWTGR